jgi:predicted unusual protein kinase regulating ubiquinone biosynthesis (AarF/ABC1/UbiB family)
MSIKDKERLSKIKSSMMSRGFALARVSVSAGAKAASHAVGNLFADEADKPERFKEMLMSQVDSLTRELGQLKGSLMKVGQLLSMYGEHFLPPEANAVLKSLQNQSPPLEWNAIEKVLKKQLSPEALATLEIDPEPLASASLGQVHKARRKSDGKWLAMKIQYPGVDQAIEGDLKALRSILSVSKLIPKGPKYDELFNEIRFMLHQEVDYAKELKTTQEFKERLSNDSRYIIPEVIPELSTKRVLTTSYEEGIPVDSPEVKALAQERRNSIGIAALELYFRELFELGAVQTDPHFGNYRVRLGKDGEPDRLVLLDFGAVRHLPKTFLKSYLKVVRGSHSRNTEMIVDGATELGFLKDEDSEQMRKMFVDLCFRITEPFFLSGTPGVPDSLYEPDGSYRWGESDLPNRIAKQASQMAISFKLRSPPREIVFLDRKLGGMFIFLSTLKVIIRSRECVEKYLVE